jgi:hypothetical protein
MLDLADKLDECDEDASYVKALEGGRKQVVDFLNDIQFASGERCQKELEARKNVFFVSTITWILLSYSKSFKRTKYDSTRCLDVRTGMTSVA